MVGALVLGAVAGCAAGGPAAPADRPAAPASDLPGIQLPPPAARWDLQLGGDAPLSAGVAVVERDWWAGRPLAGGYTICYINAFQTQPDEPGTDRPDLTRNWPADLVRRDLEDPGWPGEFLVDISTSEYRAAAAAHVRTMIEVCAKRGAQAVELDNLDSWTREVAGAAVPFGREDAVEYARLLVDRAHAVGLAAAQKNAAEMLRPEDQADMGFDFAVVEDCGKYDECGAYASVYDQVLAVEYTDEGLANACATLPPSASVIRRDPDLVPAGEAGYVYRTC